MKLQKLVETHDREYLELAHRYISKVGAGLFYLTEDGIINSRASDGFATNLDGHGYHEDTLDLFTDDGVCKLEFGVAESEFVIDYVRELRSLKNMPHTIKKRMYLIKLYNIEIFDLEIKECNGLNIQDCRFLDLSNIKNTNLIEIENCAYCDTLDKMPHNLPDAELQKLTISNTTIEQIKTNNNNIANIKFYDVWGIVNCMNFPSELERLYLYSNDFDNYTGIDAYQKMRELTLTSRKYKNIINLLLCKSIIKDLLHMPNLNADLKKIIYSFIRSNKEDYIMDCAVELIDAGFPEAAEL